MTHRHQASDYARGNFSIALLEGVCQPRLCAEYWSQDNGKWKQLLSLWNTAGNRWCSASVRSTCAHNKHICSLPSKSRHRGSEKSRSRAAGKRHVRKGFVRTIVRVEQSQIGLPSGGSSCKTFPVIGKRHVHPAMVSIRMPAGMAGSWPR